MRAVKPLGAWQLARCWQATLDDAPAALAWAPDGTLIAALSLAGTLHWLAAADGRLVRREAAHAGGGLDLAWGQAGLASSGQDGLVKLWRAPTAAPITLDAGAPWVSLVRWSPDGQWLASAAGRLVKLWTADGARHTELAPKPYSVSGLAWSPEGGTLAVAAHGGVWLHRLASPGLARHLAYAGVPLAVHYQPGGRFLVCPCQDRTVHLWDLSKGADLEITGFNHKPRGVAFEGRGRWLLAAGAGDLTAWDFSGQGPADRRPQVFQGHRGTATTVALWPTGTDFVSGDDQGELRLWRFGQSLALSSLAASQAGDAVACLSCVGTGGTLVVAYEAGGVAVVQRV